MLATPARIAALVIASASGACAAVVGCSLQTEGLASSETSGTTSGSIASSSGTTSGSTKPQGTGGQGGAGMSSSSSTSTSSGTGGAGGADAGGHDAATVDATTDATTTDATTLDAAPVDAGPTYASCQAWHTAQPTAPSGIFNLVDGSQNVYQAYCEMVNDGAGWTLALKIDGYKATFPYDNALWTNATGLNPGWPGLDMNEAKLASYWSVPFTNLRVGMVDANAIRWLVVPIGGSTLLDLINKGGGTSLGRGPWEGLLVKGSLQTNCNWEGINAHGQVRIGIVGDESTLCQTFPSPDSFIGFGAAPDFHTPSYDCGNIADGNYSPDNGGQQTPTFGYVMVR